MKPTTQHRMSSGTWTIRQAVKATMKKFDSRGKLRLYPDEMKAGRSRESAGVSPKSGMLCIGDV